MVILSADGIIPNITLRNGIKIPILGLGSSHHGGYSHESAVYALKDAGYKHIDTASYYGSERDVGLSVTASGVERSQLFITTKVWPLDFGFEKTKKALDTSLEKLDMDYVDLYLVHWPTPASSVKDKQACLKETWRAMEALYHAGKCRSIGVSNYTIEHLDDLFTYCTIKPHVNQIEIHPYCYPKALIDFCRRHDIVVAGYSPLVRMRFNGKEKLRKPLEAIAVRHKKSIAQILIRWSIQHNIVTIPKTTQTERVLENIQVFDFSLTDQDRDEIDSLCKLGYIKLCTGPKV